MSILGLMAGVTRATGREVNNMVQVFSLAKLAVKSLENGDTVKDLESKRRTLTSDRNCLSLLIFST